MSPLEDGSYNEVEYSIEGMCVAVLGKITLGYTYYLIILWTCLCMGIFFIKTMNRTLLSEMTQLLESHGFLDYLDRGIDSDGNNNNLLDNLQDTIGRGQNPISILPTAVAETEITTISSICWNIGEHDCVFGNDLDVDEKTFVSEGNRDDWDTWGDVAAHFDVLQKLNRPILYSVSPGVIPTPVMEKDISGLVNMYRVTGDDWDTWGDVAAHFDVSRDFAAANKIGAKGLLGRSWPDLDMLPVGWLSNAVKHDCVFGNDLDVDEITFVSEVLQKLNRPILYSVSPGVIPTPVMEKDISGLVNMYRVTGDDWDTWGDVAAHFDVSRWIKLLESHGFLDYLERDTIGRGQNPISILPTAVAETEITTISDPYVGILGFPQTSGQKNKKRRGNKFLQQQEELRGIDSDGNNNNLLDNYKTHWKGQNPISILPLRWQRVRIQPYQIHMLEYWVNLRSQFY
uniref:Alpha-galactosidase n=1 Tax=Salix viminalis TaxID=40686 RepID=A0A6N2MQ77_SALVM